MGVFWYRTSKWQWGPVDRPVEPTAAMGWPWVTWSPACTRNLEQWA